MHLSGFKSKKLVQISLGTTQGFDSNIKKFEDSTLCSEFVAPEFHPLIFDCKTGEEIPFRSLMPGYEKPPPSRVADPEYWEKEDKEKHAKKWEGDAIYPTVTEERLKVGGNKPHHSPRGDGQQGFVPHGHNLRRHSLSQQQHSLSGNHGNQQRNTMLPDGALTRQTTIASSTRCTADMSPHSRALHAARYSHRSASIGNHPPGLTMPRYERHHGHAGYPLPTAELYEIYSGMGANYQIPPRARRASVANSGPPGLTPDFTEFVNRLEEGFVSQSRPQSRRESLSSPAPPGFEHLNGGLGDLQSQRQRRGSTEMPRW
jgi:hypothetical protein